MVKRRSPLFMQKQPGGVFDYVNVADYPADVWFVQSTNTTYGADAAGYGQNPDAPFLTLNYAFTQVAASDVIVLLPGHAEVVAAAAGLDADVAGVTVKGVGNGSLQPTVTFTTDIAADMDVDAADITFDHVHFVAGFADITAAIDVNACNTAFIDCRFSESAVNLNALIWIQDAAAGGSDRITVENCKVVALDAANTHFINYSGTGTGHRFVGNELIGDWGTYAVGGAGAVTNIVVADNYIYNMSASNDAIINLGAATGIVVNNSTGGTAAVANGITAATCIKNNNYYADLPGGDVQGILDPVIT